jgi:viroplasmin and RNaseH domain-containing protein
MAKKQCYVVYIGKVPGLYDEWHECQAQVERFSGASHKGFKSRQEAEASYLRFTLARERNHNRRLMYYIVPLSLIVIALLVYIIV